MLTFVIAKFSRMEVRVETMWDFLMRRAVSEAIQKGIATLNSPVEISNDAKLWMKELSNELRRFYQRIGRQLSDRELALEIERRYGDQILKQVCIPNGLFQGVCLLIAVAVAKEEPVDLESLVAEVNKTTAFEGKK